MTEWMRFGDPATLQLGIRWVEDTEPPDRRPAAYGWSMGQLTMHVANVNITATKLGQDDQPYFNSNDSGKRFTIAHELCHVLFDRTRARRVAHASSGP